jgi:beta-galactosidase/beta-glucuronidase
VGFTLMATNILQALESSPQWVTPAGSCEGQHIWNLCDFKTSQSVRRMGGMNYKGVFTRDRRPKLAAHRLRELWASETNSQDEEDD